MFGFGQTGQQPRPLFGQPSPTSPFSTSTPAFPSPSAAPSFGASTPSFGAPTATPSFGTPSSTPSFGTATSTPSFGATSAPSFGMTSTPSFGTPTPQPSFGGSSFGSTSTPTFGGASSFGTSVTSAPLFGGTSTTTPLFGGSTSTSGFGAGSGFGKTSTTPAFGTPSGFGAQSAGQSFTGRAAFGGPVFGVAERGQGTMDDGDAEMGQAQTTTPFGGTTGPFGTSTPTPVFTAPAHSMFGKPADNPKPFSSAFGKRPDTPMNDSPIFGKSAAEPTSSLFGKPAVGVTEPTKATLTQSSVFSRLQESSKPLFEKAAVESKPESGSFGKLTESAPLFGKPLATSPTFGTEPKPLFGKPEGSLGQSTTLFGGAADSTKSPPEKQSLFGKVAETTAPQKRSLFGKALSDTLTKPGGESTVQQSLFGKTVKSEPGLFGKSDPPPYFSKDTASEPVTTPKIEPGLFTRTIKNEGDSTVETKFEVKTEPLGAGDTGGGLFGKLKKEPAGSLFGKPKQEPAGGLFGKTEAATEEQDDQDEPYVPLSRPHAPLTRPPGKALFGNPASLTTEAARRSVRKSLELQRSISHDDNGKEASRAPRPHAAYKSEDINKRIAVVVKNLPAKLNNKDSLRRFYERFGTVRKIFVNTKSFYATLHFDNHEQAAQAMRRGAEYCPGVKIVWSTFTGPKKRSPSKDFPDPSTSYDADTSRSVDPEKSSFSTGLDRVCRTNKEKADYLEELEKRMRADRRKETRLDKAVATVGSCMDMCPEKERYKREEQRRLHPFETFKSDDTSRGAPIYVDHAKAVKEYSRSSADQDEPLPLELRPPAVLARTMDYLVTHVMDRVAEGRHAHDKGGETAWAEWFDFLWNRTRAIRKDITQQHLCDLVAVDLLEKCTRFHIFCSVRLCELDMQDFDQKINSENLTKCLQTLKELYSDLKVRQGVECPNEAEFRGYMVLMNLNNGDILREVQNYPFHLRRSWPVLLAVQAHHSLSSNNWVRFFKLVRQAPFLHACLMFRYFTQVRQSALLTMMKAFKTKGGLQFPIADLRHQLGFEDEDDVILFCDDHGLEEAEGAIVLERQTFVEPESGAGLVRRPRGVIESKHQGLIGEIVQGGPLPDAPMLQPTFSFDSEGRYLGGYGQGAPLPDPGAFPGAPPGPREVDAPAATSSPSPSSDAVSVKGLAASPIKSLVPSVPGTVKEEPAAQKFSNEDVKAVAKELFLSVIDEIVPEMCRSLLTTARLAEHVTSQCVDVIVHEGVITQAREVCEESVREEEDRRQAFHRQQQEQERRLAERERQKEEAAGEVRDEMVDEVVEDMASQTADQAVRECEEEHQQQLLDQVLDDLRNDLLQKTTDDLVANLADEINQSCIQKQMLNEIHDTVLASRKQKVFRTWTWRYLRRVRQKNTMKNFPICHSLADQEGAVTNLLPAGVELGIVEQGFHVTPGARLTTEPVTSLYRKRNQLMERLSAAARLAELKREQAWKPLDLVTIVATEVEKEMAARRPCDRSPLESNVYWKLLVVLPDQEGDNDDDNEEAGILSEWVCHKLRKGSVPDTTNEQTELLSLYHRSAPLDQCGSVRVHVCVRTVQQSSLIDTELDSLSGTSAVLVVVPETSTEREIFEVSNSVMCDLNDLVGVPVAVLTAQEADFLDTEKQKLMTSVAVGEDVEDMKASIQLCRGLSWLVGHAPRPPPLRRVPIRSFVDDFLTREFFSPVYTNLNHRRRQGLLHQSPQVLLSLYQSAVSHLADAASSKTYVRYLWPAPEFLVHDPGLPEYGWNSVEHLDYLREALLSLTLPDFTCSSPDDEEWSAAVQDVWEYVALVVDKNRDPTQVCSRLEQTLSRARRDFEETCYLSEQLPRCLPLYVNMPWTDVIAALVDHQLAGLEWTDPMVTESEYPVELHVVYDPALLRFTPPVLWNIALQIPDRRVEQVRANIRDTVARSAKRKLDSTCAPAREAKRSTPDISRATPTSDAPPTHGAHSQVRDLKSKVAFEEQANDKLLEYMEKSVMEHDSYLGRGVSSSSMSSGFVTPISRRVSSRIHTPFHVPIQNLSPLTINSPLRTTVRGVTTPIKRSFLTCEEDSEMDEIEMVHTNTGGLDTSCLPEEVRSVVDSRLAERSLNEDVMFVRRRLEEEERAADILQMRINLMLNEPPPKLIENTQLNVLSYVSPR